MKQFIWDDYLSLAEDLVSQGGEAALRSAISRAYYAAFCKARNSLRESGVDVRGRNHLWLWEQYRRSDDDETHLVGETGDRLRQVRNRADYDDVFVGLAPRVTTAMLQASYVVQRV